MIRRAFSFHTLSVALCLAVLHGAIAHAQTPAPQDNSMEQLDRSDPEFQGLQAPAPPPPSEEPKSPALYPPVAGTPPDAMTASPAPASQVEKKNYRSIRLRGLNKATARTDTISGPIGTVLRFGSLEIIARSCADADSLEVRGVAALLDVWEYKPGEGPQQIFLGWMFSASPSLSSLQHGVYDISVIECKEDADEPEVAAEAPAKDAKPKEEKPTPTGKTKTPKKPSSPPPAKAMKTHPSPAAEVVPPLSSAPAQPPGR